jgi:uncharacterized HAD superfamily protein
MSHARYTITEIKSIRDVLSKVNHDTWVLIDLDDTIMQPWYVSVGCHTWFTMMCQLANAKIEDKHEALALTLSIYNEVQHRLHMQAVEQDIYDVIKTLHAQGVPVIGLTSRGVDLKNTTYRQLHHLVIPLLDIIFCSGKHKGQCLQTYLDNNKYRPKHMIMIDDQKKYVDQVGEVASHLSIDYDGLHYTFVNEQVRAFNFEQSHQELAVLYPVLPIPAQTAIQRLGITMTSENALHKNYFQFFYLNSQREEITPEPSLKAVVSSNI